MLSVKNQPFLQSVVMLNVIKMTVIMLSVKIKLYIMLSVVILNDVVPSVEAPKRPLIYTILAVTINFWAWHNKLARFTKKTR